MSCFTRCTVNFCCWSWQCQEFVWFPKASKQICGMSSIKTVKCGDPRAISPSKSSQMFIGSRWRNIFYPALLFSEVPAAASQGAASNGPMVSPTLDQQFPRTQYHVFSLQQIWDNKGVQSTTDKNVLHYTVGSTIWLRKWPPSPQYQQPFLPWVLSGGCGVDACKGQAFPPGQSPCCRGLSERSPDIGRKAMAQGEGQVVVAGPHMVLPTPWSPPTPSSYRREETLSCPGTEGEPSLEDMSEHFSFFSGVGVYHPASLHFQRGQEASLQGCSCTLTAFHH